MDRVEDTVLGLPPYLPGSPRFEPLLTTADPRPTLHRYLDIYCEAAELDRERARRWTQAGAVREALLARHSREPARLVRAFDTLTVALA
ncbi:hypothetical protein [Nocardia sp. NPDC051750]|uniref:hypothetical protein n=1 Tax=Nocardia sp. NPDC051750 TaxID=3364325 RepID=UPI0037AA8F2D